MPNDRQIAQLVLQVDANIAVAQRELANLARVVKQQTGDINASLATTEVAHQRMGKAFGNARIAQMELSHVVTASVDAYAAGFSPLRIMTLEMGRLAEAATFLGGGGGGGVLGKLAGFMGGPWGLAVLLGVSVLSQLFAKMGQGENAVGALVDKMRQQAKQAGDSKLADELWANSIDGLIDRNQKLIDKLKERLKAEEDLDAQAFRQAQRDKATAESALEAATKRRDNLQTQYDAAKGRPNGVGIGQGAATGGLELTALAQQLKQAKKDVSDAADGVVKAQETIASSMVAMGEATGKGLADASVAIDNWSKGYLATLHYIEGQTPAATARISAAFYGIQKALHDAASAKIDINKPANAASALANELRSGKITVDQYAAAMAKLAKQLEAAAAAAKEAKKGTGELGKQIGFGEAAAIAKGAGLTVTSAYRQQFGHGTPGHATQEDLYNDPAYNRPGNPVARPGTSAHGGINGKWALDIAFADGLTANKLKKLYGDQGVTLSAVYKEKGHFHIEGSRSQAAAAESAAKRAEVAGIRTTGAFDQASDRLDQELLQARMQLVGDYHAQAAIAAQQIDAETKKLNDSIQEQADLGKATGYQQGITEAQAKILRAKAQELAGTRKAAIAVQEYARSLDGLQASADQRYQFETEDLKFADDMATTQAEHRRLQLQILDIVYQQKDYDLKILLAKQQLAGDLEAAARTQAEINRLPTEKSQDQERTRQGTMNPLEAWAKTVPRTAAEINQALQSIEAQGIDNLADAITGVITGTKSLGEAFKDISREIIADIIRMTIRMLIFKAISSALGSAFGGGGGGGDVADSAIYDGVGFRASGGPVSAGQPYVVGEKRPELFVPKTSGFILPSVPRMNFGGGGGSAAPQQILVHVEASEDFNVKVSNLSAQQVAAAAPVIVRAARENTMRALSRPRLMGR